ncbi:tyrosine-type recombinase/integrase [Chloroflexota bacterium]
MIDTGLRISELVTLKMDDVHMDEGYLKVIGKGKKERIVPIGNQIADVSPLLEPVGWAEKTSYCCFRAIHSAIHLSVSTSLNSEAEVSPSPERRQRVALDLARSF